MDTNRGCERIRKAVKQFEYAYSEANIRVARDSCEYITDLSAFYSDGASAEDKIQAERKEAQRLDLFARDAALNQAAPYLAEVMGYMDKPYARRLVPDAKVEIVAEQGYKVRVVTKSPWWLVHLGHIVRTTLWEILRSDPRIRGVLEGIGVENSSIDLLGRLLLGPMNLWDPEKLIQNVWVVTRRDDGIAVLMNEIVSYGEPSSLGRVEVYRDDGRHVPGMPHACFDGAPSFHEVGLEPTGACFRTERGCLMCLPLSWMMLSSYIYI